MSQFQSGTALWWTNRCQINKADKDTWEWRNSTGTHTQSLSYIMTVSAAVRFIPSPPALVLSRNRNVSSFCWKSCICEGKICYWKLIVLIHLHGHHACQVLLISILTLQFSFQFVTDTNEPTRMAAFQGMHVSSVKDIDVWLLDRWMDRETDKVITMCHYASQAKKIKVCLGNTTVCPRRQQSRKSYF